MISDKRMEYIEEVIEFIDYNVFGFFNDNLEQRVIEVLDGYYEVHEITNDEYAFILDYFMMFYLSEEDEDEGM